MSALDNAALALADGQLADTAPRELSWCEPIRRLAGAVSAQVETHTPRPILSSLERGNRSALGTRDVQHLITRVLLQAIDIEFNTDA
jgi:hypothetical protein